MTVSGCSPRTGEVVEVLRGSFQQDGVKLHQYAVSDAGAHEVLHRQTVDLDKHRNVPAEQTTTGFGETKAQVRWRGSCTMKQETDYCETRDRILMFWKDRFSKNGVLSRSIRPYQHQN